MKQNTISMWCVVTGKSFNGILGLDGERFDNGEFRAVGTCFGAVYFRKRFAVKAARSWGNKARVVKVVLSAEGGAQ